MKEQTLKTRIKHKAGTENEWKLAEGKFKPLRGEFIIYLPDNNYDYSRLKIGTGEDDIKDLPFLTYSAYDIAIASGYDGTEKEWLDSLIGNGIETIVPKRISSGSNGEMEITVTTTDGTKTPFSIFNGEQGDKGDKGDTGVGIASIQTTPTDVSGEANKVKIIMTDDPEGKNPIELDVYNGKDGAVTEDQLSQTIKKITEEIQEKCHTEVFDTYEELYKMLTGITIVKDEEIDEYIIIDEEETEEELLEREERLRSFQTGDVFLVRALNVPDYWWESYGESSTFNILRPKHAMEIITPFGAARILETQKTDLTHHLGFEDQGEFSTMDLTNYKLRVAADGDTGLEGYITFII